MAKIHQASEHKFLDERGSSSASLAPNGLNRARIMEKAVVDRIVDSYFWKEQCFGVNEADVVDRVVDHVTYVGGVVGPSQRPTPFLCLAFKLLQLGPGDDVLREYLGYGGDRFKYLRALALFYVRMTRPSRDVYEMIEPYLEDRRKLRRKGRAGVSLTFVDEFADDLLTKDRVCATSLYKIAKREVLEDLDVLKPRVSPLGDLEDLLEEEDPPEKGEEGDQTGRDGRDQSGHSDDGDRDQHQQNYPRRTSISSRSSNSNASATRDEQPPPQTKQKPQHQPPINADADPATPSLVS